MSMKSFKKLTTNTVNLAVSETEYISCPMLKIEDLPAFKDGLSDSVSQDAGKQIEGRKKLIALIEQVFPLEFKDKLYRLLPQEIIILASILMFGDENDEPDEGKKKLEATFPARSSTTSLPPAGSCGNTGGGSKRSWLSAIRNSWPFKAASTEGAQTPR